MSTPFLELRSIEKSFCDIPVLSNISLKLYPGKTHGLLGCNGAGKSTLVRIIAGAIRPDKGEMLINGKTTVFKSPRDSINAGIGISTQELTIFEDMTIADNLFLMNGYNSCRLKINYAQVYNATRDILARLKISAAPDRKIGQLSQSEKFLIQFARCWMAGPKLIILDELSASMTCTELDTVHGMLDELKRSGTAVLYITHRMRDILSVSDQLTILRDGSVAMEPDLTSITEGELRKHIFGESTPKLYPKLPIRFKEEILRASDISNRYFKNMSLRLMRGEIIGVLGIAGSGRTRFLRALAGIDPLENGCIFYAGRRIASPRSRLFSNIAYIPEDRDIQALFMNFDCHKNITIRNLDEIAPRKVLHLRDEAISCRNSINRLGIRTVSFNKSVRYLSGGNKQKVVIARYLYSKCSVYLFDEPTQGIDTAGKVEVYNIISELARRGAGIVPVSSDYAELLGMCDRILIMKNGALVADCSARDVLASNRLGTFIE